MMALPVRNPIGTRRLPIRALGASLSLFFAITFTLSVLFDLWVPGAALQGSWLRLLPGLAAPSWESFFIGFAESLAIGWYVAVTFGAVFNLAVARSERLLSASSAARATGPAAA